MPFPKQLGMAWLYLLAHASTKHTPHECIVCVICIFCSCTETTMQCCSLYLEDGQVGAYCRFCIWAWDQPTSVFQKMGEHFNKNQCLDLSQPKDHCAHYNLGCATWRNGHQMRQMIPTKAVQVDAMLPDGTDDHSHNQNNWVPIICLSKQDWRCGRLENAPI